MSASSTTEASLRGFRQGPNLVTGSGWQHACGAEQEINAQTPRGGTTTVDSQLEAESFPPLPPSPVIERPAHRQRLDEEGHAVPGSQDTELAARAHQALHLVDRTQATSSTSGIWACPVEGDRHAGAHRLTFSVNASWCAISVLDGCRKLVVLLSLSAAC